MHKMAKTFVAGLTVVGTLASASSVIADKDATEPIEIQADHFEMLVAERRTTHTGNVVATQGRRAIESRELMVQFNDDNAITRMHAAGGPARLTDRTREPAIDLAGQALDYDFDTRTVRAEGNSVLSRDGDNIAAETIVYDIDTESARAVGSDAHPVTLRLAPARTTRR